MIEGHARLGPSNPRWVHCPGSVREEAAYPDIPGEAAIDGTGSHFLLECCLIHGVRAEAYEGQALGVDHPDKPNGWTIRWDRIDRVQQCLDYVSRRVVELKEEYPGHTVEVLSETRSDPGSKFGRDDWWGTVDITINVYHGETLVFVEVVDYKDGKEYVDATDTFQLVSYMAGKLLPSVKTCRMTIVQPKTTPTVRWSSVNDPQQVMVEAEKLAEAAAKTDDPEATLASGKHCQWCKHKLNCNAESQRAVALIAPIPLEGAPASSKLFELVNETFGDIASLPVEKLVELADARAGIEAVFDKVEAEMTRRLESGEQVPGYAMKPGRGKQVWSVSDEEVAKMLKARRLKQSDIFPATLISPAQALKFPTLTDKQREDIRKKYISYVGGELKLTKVRHEAVEDKAAVFNDTISFF